MNTTNDINIPHGIDGGITESNPVTFKVRLSNLIIGIDDTTLELTNGTLSGKLVLIGDYDWTLAKRYVDERQEGLENWLIAVNKK